VKAPRLTEQPGLGQDSERRGVDGDEGTARARAARVDRARRESLPVPPSDEQDRGVASCDPIEVAEESHRSALPTSPPDGQPAAVRRSSRFSTRASG
jgi:hypothetical protein